MATNRKGVLITCDIPTMQVIKFMDKQEGGKMIIKELDERNVFIHRTFSTHASLDPCLIRLQELFQCQKVLCEVIVGDVSSQHQGPRELTARALRQLLFLPLFYAVAALVDACWLLLAQYVLQHGA